MAKVTITKSKLDSLANAVAAKSGTSVLLTVDEMTEAVMGISVGEENVLEGVKVNGIELSITDKKVNIPVVSDSQAGVMTAEYMNNIWNNFNNINTNLVSKLDRNLLTVGYVLASSKYIFIPGHTAYSVNGTGSLLSTGKFYFLVPSTSTSNTNTENITVSYATIIGSDNSSNINSVTFTESGLYVGYVNNQTLQYTKMADLSDLPTKVSDLTNDLGFITTETDPTVPAWAKTQNKPTYTFSELTTYPTTINGYGITDAKIENGVITLGNNTITPLPSSTKAVDIGGVSARSYEALTTYDVSAQIENKDGIIILNSWQDDGAGYLTPNYNGLVCVSRAGVLLGRYTSGDFSAPSYSIQVRPSGVIINNLITPTADTDAANKKYVDDLVSGIDTGTVTSVGLSNATNGGLTISGSPITTNGSITVGHTNVLSAAQTTLAVYPIRIDKNGHISAYGVAVTSMPASDVYEWAKAESKPTYTATEVGAISTSHVVNNITAEKITAWDAKSDFSGSYNDLTDKPTIPTIPTNISSFTNDSGYLTSSDIASVLIYRGTKANYAALPSSGNTTGDVWHLTDTGAEYAWDGSTWQELGTAIDLSGYAEKATTLAGYGITDAKIQNGVITLGSNTITPLTSYTETDPIYSASVAAGITATDITNWNNKSDFSGSYNDLTDKPTIPTIPTNISAFNNDSGYLTSYTETDPVFNASAAAGITATDISNWNAKVSDTKTWGDVVAPSSRTDTSTTCYIPQFSATNSSSTTTATFTLTRVEPFGLGMPKWDNNKYLYAETPSANDNSTKVATTAYVDAAIPDTSNFLTLATLPIYDGTVE